MKLSIVLLLAVCLVATYVKCEDIVDDIHPGNSVSLDTVSSVDLDSFEFDDAATSAPVTPIRYSTTWDNTRIQAAMSTYTSGVKPTSALIGDFKTIVAGYQKLIAELSSKPEMFRVNRVNGAINAAIRYVAEAEDTWQTPLETLWKRRGDCEDYAILKYFILTATGIDPEKLRLLYGKVHNGQGHLVLGYLATPTSDPYIIDNRSLIGYYQADMKKFGLDEILQGMDIYYRYFGGVKFLTPKSLPKWGNLILKVAEEGMLTQITPNKQEAEIDSVEEIPTKQLFSHRRHQKQQQQRVQVVVEMNL